MTETEPADLPAATTQRLARPARGRQIAVAGGVVAVLVAGGVAVGIATAPHPRRPAAQRPSTAVVPVSGATVLDDDHLFGPVSVSGTAAARSLPLRGTGLRDGHALTVPDGWEGRLVDPSLASGRLAAVVDRPAGTGVEARLTVQVTPASAATLKDHALAVLASCCSWLSSFSQVGQVATGTVGGQPSYAYDYTFADANTSMRGRVTMTTVDGQVVVLDFTAPQDEWATDLPPVMAALASLH